MKLRIIISFAIVAILGSFAFASFPVKQETNATEQVATSPSVDQTLDQSYGGGQSGKSQLIALLLAIFVGAIGIHRFYLGYTWQGVVQLLTGGLCGVWALIDLIRIITGDLKPKSGNYSKTL